jgi:hypothetical protein
MIFFFSLRRYRYTYRDVEVGVGVGVARCVLYNIFASIYLNKN